MKLLYFLERIRTPLLDGFFSAVTFLGHELIPIALICILYWCVNKRLAYTIGFSFFASGALTQGLKITFRINRPWIIDPDFKPVGNAIDEATSYSFPSGHTQSATSVYSSLCFAAKKLWLRILCIAAFVLVGISRMYLGVHTLKDVATAMLLTLIITWAVFYLVDKTYDSKKADIFISLIMLCISLALIIYSLALGNKKLITNEAIKDCIKAGAAGIAFAIGYFVEKRFINFDTKTKKVYMQIPKVIIGLVIALLLKSGLKPIVGDNLLGDGIRYFILVIFIVIIYPFVLKLLGKHGLNK